MDKQATAPGTRETFEVAFEAAQLIKPTISGGDGREHVLLPQGMKLDDISDPYRLAPFAHAAIGLDEKQSLIDYLKRFALAGTVLVADFDSLKITASIDYHNASETMKTPGAVGSCKHQAVFALRPSEEFTRWDKFEGDLHPQDEFAAFMEENAVDVMSPAATVMMEIARDLEAVQDVKFQSSTRLESGDRSFTYTNETQTKGNVRVPTEFVLNIPLYQGESPVELRAALRFRVLSGGLVLGFEWRRVQYQRLAYFRQIATEIVSETGVPVFYGRR